MPILLPCACGRRLKVKDDLAGRKIRCPECTVILRVPQPETESAEEGARLTVLDDTSSADSSGRSVKERSSGITDRRRRQSEEEEEAPPRRRRSEPEEEDAQPRRRRYELQDEDEPPRRRRYELDDEDDSAERRRRKRAREERQPRVTSEGGGFGSINAGMAGGVLMMLIAVVWFVGGLAVGFIFFYPPILFIIGIGAFFKGIADRA